MDLNNISSVYTMYIHFYSKNLTKTKDRDINWTARGEKEDTLGTYMLPAAAGAFLILSFKPNGPAFWLWVAAVQNDKCKNDFLKYRKPTSEVFLQ